MSGISAILLFIFFSEVYYFELIFFYHSFGFILIFLNLYSTPIYFINDVSNFNLITH